MTLPAIGSDSDPSWTQECSEGVADLWRAAVGCVGTSRTDLVIRFLREAVRLASAENRATNALGALATREAHRRGLSVAASMVDVLVGRENDPTRARNVFELFRAAFLLLEIAYRRGGGADAG